MIVKMLKELERRMDKQSDRKYKEEPEIKNTITKMKNTLEGINCRLNDKEEQISELEERAVDITEAEQRKEKRIKRNEDSLRNL